MLLIDPPATPFDLRFRLFGVDVRVHPFFWLLSVILGWNVTTRPVLDDSGMLDLLVWVLAVFVSILLHEFGHVWMGQVFGSRGHIVLHSMGGLAIGSSNVPSSWQRILVIAAGPGIQLLLFAAIVVLLISGTVPFPDQNGGWGARVMLKWLAGPERMAQLAEANLASPALSMLLSELLLINFFWALLNLLPIWPLDGGQITREVCAGVSPRNGVIAALYISLALSAVVAVNALMGYNGNPFLPWYAPTGMWPLILFGMLAVGSWQAIQQEKMAQHEYGSEADDRMPWER